MDQVSGDVVFGLIDLSEVDPAGLAELDNPVLTGVLRGLREEAEHPEDAIAGFDSSF